MGNKSMGQKGAKKQVKRISAAMAKTVKGGAMAPTRAAVQTSTNAAANQTAHNRAVAADRTYQLANSYISSGSSSSGSGSNRKSAGRGATE